MAKSETAKLFTKVTGVTQDLEEFKASFKAAYPDDWEDRFKARVKALIGEGAMFDKEDAFGRVADAHSLLSELGIEDTLSEVDVETGSYDVPDSSYDVIDSSDDDSSND